MCASYLIVDLSEPPGYFNIYEDSNLSWLTNWSLLNNSIDSGSKNLLMMIKRLKTVFMLIFIAMQVFRLIQRIRQKTFWVMIYWSIRIGLGLTFIISGIRKLPGVKFTILPPDNPVGAYFHAMHETGMYWNFIGYFQILIGLLIFSNRFVILSSVLMMPVTVNIFLVSVALNMRGTPAITTAMLLGNLFLLFYKLLAIKWRMHSGMHVLTT